MTAPRPQKPFPFEKYHYRPVALKIAYLGWPYHGLAAQETDTVATVESVLFAALQKVRLIVSRAACGYSRCGRTDRGVSATEQVLGLWLRSNLSKNVRRSILSFNSSVGRLAVGDAISTDEASHVDNEEDESAEIDYVAKLNAVLPAHIRILAWAETTADFSARFACTERTYQYYFHDCGLDVELMRAACARLVGTHDFRMFCKVDGASAFKTMERTVVAAHVERVASTDGIPGALWRATIRGRSFLWHQVRCMMAVLFLVAQRREDVGLVDALLDPTQHSGVAGVPRGRPAYEIAPELPLVLMQCEYSNVALRWRSPAAGSPVARRAQQPVYDLWLQHTLQAALAGALLREQAPSTSDWEALAQTARTGAASAVPAARYVPVLKRPRCHAVEERQRQQRG